MKKKILMILAAAMFAIHSFADAGKGQEYYLEYLKPIFGDMKGEVFTQEYLQVEWKRMFRKEGSRFIEIYSERFPEAKDFLESEKFQEIMPDISDFAIKYAADSGELPTCE